jgi:hypothetical protein
MALDRCLPQFLLTKNSWRDTNHYIILTYLILASSQVLAMQGDVDALAGVYRSGIGSRSILIFESPPFWRGTSHNNYNHPDPPGAGVEPSAGHEGRSQASTGQGLDPALSNIWKFELRPSGTLHQHHRDLPGAGIEPSAGHAGRRGRARWRLQVRDRIPLYLKF